jgi:hypothetical protein
MNRTLLSRAAIATAVVLGLMTSVVSPRADANPITVAVEALEATVDRFAAIAITYAAAHTVTGTGAMGSGLCVDVNILGGTANCASVDSVTHDRPPGNDVALASAFASSGRNITHDPNTFTDKGDLAIAGAYAKGGGVVRTSGDVSFDITLNLGSVSVNAAADPGLASYGVSVSNAGLGALNRTLPPDVIREAVQQNGGPPVQQPDGRYYDLRIDFNAETGELRVVNTSQFMTAGTLLTADDFETSLFSVVDPLGNSVPVQGFSFGTRERVISGGQSHWAWKIPCSQ